MPVATVVSVVPGSPADEAGILAGDEVHGVNGEAIRDVIRYQLHADEPRVELEVRREGADLAVTVDKAPGAALGIELDSAVFDRVRTCDNHCSFCFIYQLPKGLRRSLYLKDDDYRLSFLYGNFTTLTRFTEADFERVVTEGLSPLYVSIHVTDPEVRAALLRNPRGAMSLRWLRLLLEAGVEVHGQLVICPGLNDGPVLDDTLLGILDQYPGLADVGAVPLGISAFNREAELREHTPAEAAAVLDTIAAWQERFLAVLGRRMVFAADEYYLMAGRPFPAAEEYETFAQHENGIGMARTFWDEVDAALAGESVDGEGPRSGFFAWVDGAPADGYRAPRTALEVRDRRATEPGAPGPAGAAVTLLTGAYGEQVLAGRLGELSTWAGVPVVARPVANRFFGGNTSVTGLLTGGDVAAELARRPPPGRVLLPDVCLSRGRFLDGTTLDDLGHPVEVVGTDGASLVRALEPAPART